MDWRICHTVLPSGIRSSFPSLLNPSVWPVPFPFPLPFPLHLFAYSILRESFPPALGLLWCVLRVIGWRGWLALCCFSGPQLAGHWPALIGPLWTAGMPAALILTFVIVGTVAIYLLVSAKLSQVALRTYREWRERTGEAAVFDQLTAKSDVENQAAKKNRNLRRIRDEQSHMPPPPSLPYHISATEENATGEAGQAGVVAAGAAALASAAGARPPTGQSRARRDLDSALSATPAQDADSTSAGKPPLPVVSALLPPTPPRTAPYNTTTTADAATSPAKSAPQSPAKPSMSSTLPPRPGTGTVQSRAATPSEVVTTSRPGSSLSENASSRPVTRQGIASLLPAPSQEEFKRALSQARTSLSASADRLELAADDASAAQGDNVNPEQRSMAWSDLGDGNDVDVDGILAGSPVGQDGAPPAPPPPEATARRTLVLEAEPPAPMLVAPDALPPPLALTPAPQAALDGVGDAAGVGIGALEALGATAWSAGGTGGHSTFQTNAEVLFVPRLSTGIVDDDVLQMDLGEDADEVAAPVGVRDSFSAPPTSREVLAPVGGASPGFKLMPIAGASPVRHAEV